MEATTRHLAIAKSQRLKTGITATGEIGIEGRRQHSEVAGETVQGARIEDLINHTAMFARRVHRRRGGGRGLRHLHQTPEKEIREKRADAHAGGQVRRDPLALFRRTAVRALHVHFGKLPTPQDPATLHQIPTTSRSGVLDNHLLLEIVGLDRETEYLDRSTMANNPRPAPPIHPHAL